MSGTFPTTPAPSRMVVASEENNFVSYTQAGYKFVDAVPGHKWLMSMSFPMMERAEFMPLYAFAVKQRGVYSSFQIIPPDTATPLGAYGGSPVVDGASQTGRTLDVRGGSLSITDWGVAGDFFLAAGNNKVYMLTENASTDGSGDVTLTFEPELIIEYADGAALTTSDVPFTMSLKDDNVPRNVSSPIIYEFALQMVEDISV